MKILFTTRMRDKSGSWQIRGRQLGEALGADIIPNATIEQQRQYEWVIHVKRFGDVYKPNSILDMVDAWPQPEGNLWTREQAIEWGIRYSKPFRYTIGATQRMRDDLGLSWHLRHHYRPESQANQISALCRTIGYEGSPKYISEWLPEIMRQCEQRGWTFLINPTNLDHCDAMIAVRGGEWRGYTTDHWKSNVKMANAIAHGIPLIALPESGYCESVVPFIPVNEPADIGAAFDQLTIAKLYSIAESCDKVREHYSIESIAVEYAAWLQSLK